MAIDERSAVVAFQNNLRDSASMLAHLEERVEAYARDVESGFDPRDAEFVRDLREALVAAVMTTGLDREDIEQTLEEQRDADGGGNAVEIAAGNEPEAVACSFQSAICGERRES